MASKKATVVTPKFKKGDKVVFKNFEKAMEEIRKEAREASSSYMYADNWVRDLRRLGESQGPYEVLGDSPDEYIELAPTGSKYSHRWHQDMFDLAPTA